MTTREASLMKAFGIAFGLIAVVTFLVIRYANPEEKTQVGNRVKAGDNKPLQLFAKTPEVQTMEVHSSDGTMKLVMRAEPGKDDVTTYTFTASDISGGNPKQLLTKTYSGGTTMGIPYTSWSPDNKLVFVQINNGSAATYLVLKADGTPFAGGDQLLNVNDFWTASKNQYTIRTVTGWASGDLLIVYTTKDDGTNGPAFWFVTESHNFLQLAR